MDAKRPGRFWKSAWLVLAAAWWLAPAARAQSGPALLVKPWSADQAFEGQASGYILNGGHTEETGHSFQLSEVESQGRLRLFPGNEASPRLGYDLTFLDSATNQANFPKQLIDASFAGGAFVGKYNDWIFGVTAGLGYAGDSPFGNGRAWYAKADALVARKFGEHDALGVGIDYDGHRTYMPDVPLPGFGYSHEFDPHLQMVIGAPISSITWKPDEHWRFYLDYELVNQFDIDIGYEFLKHWTVYGGFDSRQDAFWIGQLPDHKRLLYSQRRAELGIRFKPTPHFDFVVAGGYAFSTDFRSGWDFRSSKRYLYASDEPYVRIGLDVKF